MADLVLHRRVQRYARRLPANIKESVKTSLAKLAEGPDNYPGVVSMSGQWQGYKRIRIGDLRIIFVYDESKETVYVDYLGPRGEIYRRA